MPKYIKTIVDANGDTIFPRTRVKAIKMDDGMTDLKAVLDAKADQSHTHDGLYLSPEEATLLLNAKADQSHSHEDLYYNKEETTLLINAKADQSHSHGDLYYSKEAIDLKFGDIDTILDNILGGI